MELKENKQIEHTPLGFEKTESIFEKYAPQNALKEYEELIGKYIRVYLGGEGAIIGKLERIFMDFQGSIKGISYEWIGEQIKNSRLCAGINHTKYIFLLDKFPVEEMDKELFQFRVRDYQKHMNESRKIKNQMKKMKQDNKLQKEKN
jgi:hypothetical protein